jgi:hypothetical protein
LAGIADAGDGAFRQLLFGFRQFGCAGSLNRRPENPQ